MQKTLSLWPQGMAFSVAMNSKRANAIVALLIASNFAEIKGVVFKRFDARRLLILSCQARSLVLAALDVAMIAGSVDLLLRFIRRLWIPVACCHLRLTKPPCRTRILPSIFPSTLHLCGRRLHAAELQHN